MINIKYCINRFTEEHDYAKPNDERGIGLMNKVFNRKIFFNRVLMKF